MNQMAIIERAISPERIELVSDEALLAAEKEFAELYERIDAEGYWQTNGVDENPRVERANELDLFIREARPAGIVGAIVKIRRTIDAATGIEPLTERGDLASIRMALDVLVAHAGPQSRQRGPQRTLVSTEDSQ